MEIKDSKPQVGIFEVIDGKVFVLTRELDFSKANNICDDAGEYFHEDLVKYVINQCSDEAKAKYKSMRQGFLAFPRGRVGYNFNNDKYQIFTCREVATNSRLLQTVIREFSLPRNKVMTYIDAFYEM